MSINISSKGSFSKTMDFLNRSKSLNFNVLHKYGEEGLAALREATPVKTGLTANSWGYRIIQTDTTIGIEWYNTNVQNGWAPVAILLQYGHATGTGGYVEGRDYINPAMKPIFDRIEQNVWREVTKK